ncbi:beta-barrel assembly-enhancing protease [mine drainage metagenome]|uniref:Beta-barrel assembly-enhancing protease n=1 Tax=mine drainage metagenome TaxID=410659 RepID=A0A1J5QYI7_9ZZZZ
MAPHDERQGRETRPRKSGPAAELAAVEALARAGRVDEAIRQCAAIVAREGNSADAHALLGMLRLQSGNAAAAVASMTQAVRLAPASPMHACRLGIALQGMGRRGEAIEAYRRSVELGPRWLEGWCRLAAACEAAEQWADASGAYERALELAPDSPEIMTNLAMTRLSRRDFAGSASLLETVVSKKPALQEAWNGLGVAYKGLNRLEEAIRALGRALELKPGDPDLLCNLGNCHMGLLDDRGALQCYRRAQELSPGFPAAVFAESICLLALGDYPDGFAKYESRWDSVQKLSRRTLPGLRWDGTQALEGRTILVLHEQGLGDTLQFMRFAVPLADRGANVVLEVQPPLLELARSMDPRVTVVATKQYPPAWDYYCPMLSLPLHLGMDLGSVPAPAAYLWPDPALASAWAARVADAPGLRVGLVASGNPNHKNDHNRSIPLAALEPVFAGLGTSVFLVQKEVSAADRATLAAGSTVRELSPQLTDFSQTAAAVAAMDVVVTVDTSVAHLSGALGRPTFVLLPYYPDWRWLLRRSDSPWYPSVRLFRQAAPGTWSEALASLREALAGLAYRR